MPELKFSTEEAQSIRKQYESGLSLHKLGTQYDCSPDTIKATVIRAGGKTRRIRLVPKEDRVLRKRYEGGESTVVLAQEYGISDATVARAIRRAGGTIKPLSERYKLFDKVTRRQIAQEYLDGKTLEQVAEQFSCSPSVVHNAVLEQGENVRGTGQARIVPHSLQNGIEGKVCRLCGQWKPLSRYHRAKRNSDGLRHRCKSCARKLTRTWHVENPVKSKDQRIRRRMREDAAFVSEIDSDNLYAEYGHRCAYCGQSNVELTIDHVVPITLGGSHTRDNVVPACRRCNASKNNTPLVVWLARGGPPAWDSYGRGNGKTTASTR